MSENLEAFDLLIKIIQLFLQTILLLNESIYPVIELHLDVCEMFVDFFHLLLPVFGVGDEEEVLFLPGLEDLFDLLRLFEEHRLVVRRWVGQ
jgi:hypothetical protein